MRVNTNGDAVCCECGNGRSNSIELFDIMIGGEVFTLCDLCNDMLFQKVLRASCSVSSKVKSPADMLIIKKRRKKAGLK